MQVIMGERVFSAMESRITAYGRRRSGGEGGYIALNGGHGLPNNACQAPAAVKHRCYVAVLRILLPCRRHFISKPALQRPETGK